MIVLDQQRALPRKRDYVPALLTLIVFAICAAWGAVDLIRRLVEWVGG